MNEELAETKLSKERKVAIDMNPNTFSSNPDSVANKELIEFVRRLSCSLPQHTTPNVPDQSKPCSGIDKSQAQFGSHIADSVLVLPSRPAKPQSGYQDSESTADGHKGKYY